MDLAEPISKDEWVDWKNSKVTKLFMQALFNKREDIKEGMAEGKFDSDFIKWVGYCQGVGDILQVWIENQVDFQEEDKDA